MYNTLLVQAANITKERLASFDRPIKSEPSFKPDQQQGLLQDLTNYLQTLKACREPNNPLATPSSPHPVQPPPSVQLNYTLLAP